MATYKLYKKTSDTAKEEIQIPASSVSGLANVATSGNYNDLTNKPTIPTNYVTTDTTQTISGAKTFVSDIYISQTSGQNAGITWQSASDNTNRGIFRHYDDGTTENFVTQSNGFLFRPLNNNNTKSIKVDPAVGALYPEKNSGADLGKTAQRWNNGYITNLQLCKVINGGGGNSLIQQNSDTSGADITVGSNNCPLKLQGKNARPVYRQGEGSYNNIALQSDIPKFSLSGTTLTITL